jgi:hypothetical protein
MAAGQLTGYVLPSTLRNSLSLSTTRDAVRRCHSRKLVGLALVDLAVVVLQPVLMIALLLRTAASSLKSRRALVLENLALRHQLQVLQRSAKRPRLSKTDRGLWVLFSRMFAKWRDFLFIVKPDTVVGWHRKGFRLYWRWKSGKPRRPKVLKQTRDVEPPETGKVVAIPQVGGLHHRYTRTAA